MVEATDSDGADDADDLGTLDAGREAVRQYRQYITRVLASRLAAPITAGSLLFAQVAAAQSSGGGDVAGWCGVPGGPVVLPLVVLLAQGILFLVGGFKGVS
ncbi:hypothetical protein, partial [Candidatus Halobonum tyrrellensis]|uniref:hypothetical protein n=1 Tax=Candidatus Halobonum tyrrellensis TaxID=1431545 RepID=UPI00126900CE